MSNALVVESSPAPRPARRSPPPRRLVAATVAFTLLVIVSAVAAVVGYRSAAVDPAASVALPVPSPAAPAIPLHSVADRLLSRVVTIEAERGDGEELGTGWLLNDRGDFVTNAHVIEGHVAVRVRDRAARTHQGVIMGVDRDQDIALVRSVGGFAGTPLSPAGRADPPVPSDVAAIASGRATGHDDITTATLARLHQDVPVKGNPAVDPVAGATTTVYHDMMTLRGATVYAGNSGGPLIDGSGRVLGIVTLKSKDAAQAFAIPVNRVIDELRAFADRTGPAE